MWQTPLDVQADRRHCQKSVGTSMLNSRWHRRRSPAMIWCRQWPIINLTSGVRRGIALAGEEPMDYDSLRKMATKQKSWVVAAAAAPSISSIFICVCVCRLMLERSAYRPVGMLDNERYAAYSVWCERRILPSILVSSRNVMEPSEIRIRRMWICHAIKISTSCCSYCDWT